VRFSRTFPAHVFNRGVELFLRGLPFAGARILVSQVSGGWLVSLRRDPGWRHPWFTEANWNATARRWEAHVQAGFVNGMDPLVPGVGPKVAGVNTDADLVDDPAIPLTDFRPLGNDEGDEAPIFFQKLGVRKNQNSISTAGGALTVDTTNRDEIFPLPQRFLRACDISLSVARMALVGTVDIVDPTATSGQEVLYRVGMDTSTLDRYGVRARLFVTSQYEDPHKPTLVERLLGTAFDASEDTKLISTVFLLSPPSVDGEPDGSWTPYVRHRTFWNLKHANRNARPVEPPAPIRLFTGLAGGLGDSIGNQILAQVNEFSDRVSNALNAVSNEGKFWTC
jgi:hypothetical protein